MKLFPRLTAAAAALFLALAPVGPVGAVPQGSRAPTAGQGVPIFGRTITLTDPGSTGDVSAMIAAPAGTLSSRSLALRFGDEKNAADYAQAGDTGIAQAINRAIVAASGSGVVRIPPGTYASPGDILIKQVGRVTNGASGNLVLDARGVIFTGTGNLIVDSSKRVTIRGLDAKGYTLALRGMWFSRVEDSNFDAIAFGDGTAGTDYSSNYWNIFDNVGRSVVRTQAESNANIDRSPIFRGDAQQGWATARAYAYEFNGNVNVQAMRVIGGDVSYYSSGIYTVGASNTSGDVDLTIEGGTYFDTLALQPWTGRGNVRVTSRNTFLAQPKSLTGGPVAAVSHNEQEAWSSGATMGWRSFADVNFVPNGDFAIGMSSYVGAGRPFMNVSGATVTEQTGGVNGRYLNVNQAGSGIVYAASEALPFTGQYTPAVLARAGGGTGTATVQFGFNSQYAVRTLGADWELITFSLNTPMAAGTQYPITLNNAAGFNIDVMYVGVVLGDRAPLLSPSKPPAIQERSNTITPGTIAAGPVYGPISYIGGFTGLARGDFVEVSYDQSLQGCQLIPDIASANQVTAQIYCPSGNPSRTLAAGTMRARVRKASP